MVHRSLFSLPLNDLHRLCRSLNIPHLAESIHIKRKIVKLVLISRHRAVDIIVELCKSAYIVPHFLVRRVENVRTVTVNMDTVLLFCVDVARDMVPAVDHKACPARLFHLMRKNRSVQTCSDD